MSISDKIYGLEKRLASACIIAGIGEVVILRWICDLELFGYFGTSLIFLGVIHYALAELHRRKKEW